MKNNINKYFQFRNYFPKGIAGRMFLLVVIPIIMSQILTGYIFYKRHWKTITNQNAISFVGDVLTIVDIKKESKTLQDFESLQQIAKRNFIMDVEWIPEGKITQKRNSKHLTKLSLKYVYKFLNQNLGMPYSLIANEDDNSLKIAIQYPDGILNISSSLKSVFSKTFYVFFIWMFGSAFIFILIAIPFLMKQINSIKKLTRVISFAGRGERIENFIPTGASQIREAGFAFIRTYNKIQNLIKSRTEMLSAISSDIKTPISHMKLELEFSTDKDLQFALLHDIENMEKTIDTYLEFSNNLYKEDFQQVNITKSIRKVIKKLNKGSFDIEFNTPKEHYSFVKPFAFEKAFGNVLTNAIKYGNKKIYINIEEIANQLCINVEDNGDGIPQNKMKEVFKPFVRIDKFENKGAGLGLAITQEIINQHNGEISLEKSKKLGGLRVSIKIPK